MKRFMFLISMVFVFVSLAAQEAPAEASNVDENQPSAEEAPAADPHHFIYFKPQLSASYTHNRYVAGKADGHYFQADANIVFNYKYKKDMHEILTDLNWKEGTSYTPAFDGWVIANDLFTIDFRYNLMFHKIAGYYLKAGLETHLLPGYDYHSDEMTYQDQEENELAKGKKKYKTSKSGKPFYLTEGTGIFVRPVEEESANLEIYAGFAGREVFVDDSYVLSDVEGDVATLKALDDVYELGGEIGLLLKGDLHKKVLSYDLTSRVIMPFVFEKDTYRDSNDKFKYSDAVQFETRFRLDISVYKYVAFNYELNFKRDFSTIRDWQVSNALYLSIFYELDKNFN